MWRPQSDALGARCVFCNFPYFHVPTWEVALVTFQSAPSGAHMWNQKVIGIKSLCLEGLVDYPIQPEDIIIYLCAFQGIIWVFFRQYCCFLPVMMSSGDRVSQRCAQLTS